MSENNLSKALFGNRVLDFEASRKVKAKTGQVKAIPLDTTPESPEMEKHINEAMALANPVKPKKSLLDKGLDKLGKALGFEAE